MGFNSILIQQRRFQGTGRVSICRSVKFQRIISEIQNSAADIRRRPAERFLPFQNVTTWSAAWQPSLSDRLQRAESEKSKFTGFNFVVSWVIHFKRKIHTEYFSLSLIRRQSIDWSLPTVLTSNIQYYLFFSLQIIYFPDNYFSYLLLSSHCYWNTYIWKFISELL